MRVYPNYQIDMVKGDTLSFGLEFDGLGQDLDTADFTVKVNATDPTALIHKSLGHGITKQEDYKYIIRMDPEDTADLDAGSYNFDVQISANGDVFTIMLGVLILEQDVTWEEDES